MWLVAFQRVWDGVQIKQVCRGEKCFAICRLKNWYSDIIIWTNCFTSSINYWTSQQVQGVITCRCLIVIWKVIVQTGVCLAAVIKKFMRKLEVMHNWTRTPESTQFGATGRLITGDIFQVSIGWAQMNDGDAFILDVGTVLFVWNGKTCSRTERIKVTFIIVDSYLLFSRCSSM